MPRDSPALRAGRPGLRLARADEAGGGARGAPAGGARSSPRERPGWRRRAPCAPHMGRSTEAAAAGGGASAARSAGPPPAPLPRSATSPGGTATMAFSEEDGSNGGASEAGDEREGPGERRRRGWVATAWLTLYNIAMTAGYVRPKVPAVPQALPALLFPGTPRPGRRLGCGGRPAPGARGWGAGRCVRTPAAGRSRRPGPGQSPWGRGAGAATAGGGGLNGAGRGIGPGSPALPNTVHGGARRRGARAGG